MEAINFVTSVTSFVNFDLGIPVFNQICRPSARYSWFESKRGSQQLLRNLAALCDVHIEEGIVVARIEVNGSERAEM